MTTRIAIGNGGKSAALEARGVHVVLGRVDMETYRTPVELGMVYDEFKRIDREAFRSWLAPRITTRERKRARRAARRNLKLARVVNERGVRKLERLARNG